MTIAINGSGTITGITAGGLPDAIITQPEMATGVAGTGPAFSVGRITSDQAITPNVYVKVQFNETDFDTASCWSSANYRWTPNVAGYYQINLNVTLYSSNAAGSDSSDNIAVIYKNGVEYAWATLTGRTAYRFTPKVSTILYLNGSTDYVEGYAFIVQTNGVVQSSANGSRTQMSGCLVRAA